MQRHVSSPILLVLGALLFVLAGAAALRAQEPAPGEPPTPEEEELIERILELRRQIDELLDQLPPHLREAVAHRAQERPPSKSQPPGPQLPRSRPAPPAAAADLPPPRSPAAAVAAPPEARSATPTAPTPADAPPTPRPRWRRRSCNTLASFDTDGDGRVGPLDRYYRYLHLWIDKNGDGRADEREITSTWEEKVREIATDLDSFIGGKRGFMGEIRLGDYVELDLHGDGFGASSDDGVLVIDASALKRGDGPELLTPEGEPLDGFQPFTRGLRLRDAAGGVTRLDCP